MESKKITFDANKLVRRVVAILVLLLFAGLWWHERSKLDEQLSLNEAQAAEMEVFKNKEGQYVAKIQSFETQRAKDFLAFQSRDSLIIELQKDVKSMKKFLKDKGSVTNFTSQTQVDTSSETEVIPNESEPSFPSYRSKFNLDNWVVGSSYATKDSTFLDLKIRNEYSVVVGEEPTGFLGLGTPKSFAQVTNKNPYTQTETLTTFQVATPRPKRWVIGPSFNYSFTIQEEPKLIPTIGFGVTYGLIRF